MSDEATDFRKSEPEGCARAPAAREQFPSKEAYRFAWRPAGSSSLAERWLAAGTPIPSRKPGRADISTLLLRLEPPGESDLTDASSEEVPRAGRPEEGC